MGPQGWLRSGVRRPLQALGADGIEWYLSHLFDGLTSLRFEAIGSISQYSASGTQIIENREDI